MPNTLILPIVICASLASASYFLFFGWNLPWKKKKPTKPGAVIPPAIPVPEKFFLGVALSRVNPRYYGGWEGKLGGTIPDVRLFERNLSPRGFTIQLVLDDKATRSNVTKILGQYALRAKAGDTVCIAYSGHGNNVTDVTGDENDGMDETWVLWDGELIDDNLWTILKRFKPGVRVLMFSDSCHSGTMYRNARRDTSLKSLETLDEGTLDCHLKYFGGSQDSQFSMDLGSNGLFTRTLWNSVYKNRRMTYDMLFKRMYDKMPKDQKPTYHNIGTIIPLFNTEDIF